MAGASSSREATAWTAVCPEFFKVYFPHVSSRQLLIPYAFVEEHEAVLSQKVVLTNSTGNNWPVNLEQRDESLFFKEGWADFVKDNGLKLGEFIVFTYIGNSTFLAKLYGINACEKKIEIATLRPDQPSLRQEAVREQEEAKKAEEEEKSRTIPSHSHKRKNKRAFVDHLSVQFERMLRRGQNSVSDLWDLEVVNRFEDDVASADQSSSHMPRDVKRSPSDPVVEKIGSRLAFEAAMRYVPKFPSFIITITPAYIFGNSLNIPRRFSVEHMKFADQYMKLQTMGRSWKASAHCYYEKSIKLDNGWSTFVKDNGIQIGDVCVFELIKEIGDVIFEVSIFRCCGQA